MDLPRQALETYFRIRFRKIGRKPDNIQRITRLALCKRVGGGICADKHAF